jgi:PadR family transcriptional regulator, regulatory protein PadR
MAGPPNLDLLLLEVLVAGPTHGYGLITVLRERSDGLLDYPEGTIYPALHRLEGDGLARSETTVVDGRARRVYRITTAGRSARAERRSAWRSYAAAVESVLAQPRTVRP